MIALNTEAVREMVERNALAIDPDAALADWPEALSFQIEMARAVIREIVETCAKVCDEQSKEPECPERAKYCAEAVRALVPNDRVVRPAACGRSEPTPGSASGNYEERT